MTAERGEEGPLSSYPKRPADVSLLHLDVHLNAAPWRLTPAWVAILTALIVAGWDVLREQPARVLALAFVVDAIWGGWWRLAVTPPGDALPRTHASLPYAHPRGPWAYVDALFARGTFSFVLITGGVLAGLALWFTADILWWSAVAFVIAIVAWWLRRICPSALLWWEPVFTVGIPLLSAAYLFGVISWRVVLLAVALTMGQWALRGTRWRRGVWGTLALMAWTGVLIGQVSAVVLGGTLGVLLITLLSEDGPSTATDVAWLGVLAVLALAR